MTHLSLLCMSCVSRMHPSMLTTYCLDARCRHCHRFGIMAMCVMPGPAQPYPTAESMNIRRAMLDTPMSQRERESAAEVFSQYEGLDLVAAWKNLRRRACDTARPFRAYDCAHAVASELAQAGVASS